MRVRIRLPFGKRIALRPDPRRRAAGKLSVMMLQAAAFGYAMTVWKYGYDLGRVDEFAVDAGWLSRWQLWGALALWAHALSMPLRWYADKAERRAEVRAIPQRPQPSFSLSSRRPYRSVSVPQYRAG